VAGKKQKGDGRKKHIRLWVIDFIYISTSSKTPPDLHINEYRLTTLVTEKEIFENYNGMGISDFGEKLLAKHGVNATKEEIKIIRQQRDAELQKLISRRIAAIPGTLNFIQYAHSKNIPMAIASGSKREFILQVIESLGIKDYFPVIVSRY